MKKKLYFLIYNFLLLTLSSISMDDPLFFKKTIDIGPGIAEFKKKIHVWNNEDLIRTGTKWTDFIPQNVIITPDEKGAVIAFPGVVSYINFEALNGLAEPHPLVKYTHNMYCPIIAVAMQKNKLLVASVLNGIRDKLQAKAECIISHNNISHADQKSHNIFSRQWYETKGLDANTVQALQFSCDGTVLAAAFKNSIQIMDLLSGKSRTCFFLPRIKQDCVVDVSAPHGCLSPNEQHIAAVNNKGVLDFKKFWEEEGEIIIANIKDVCTDELIEKIHLFETQELLYVTQLGEVKIINPYDWLEHIKGNIKNRTISHHAGNKAAIDQNLRYGTVHWIAHSDLPENSRFQIHIYRENDTEKENFVITMPTDLSKTYNFINAMGQEGSQATYLLLAALRGNSVVALATDGCLYRWTLPQTYKVPTENEVKNNSMILHKGKIKRSISSVHEPKPKIRPRSATDGGEDKAKKNIKIPRSRTGGSKELRKRSYKVKPLIETNEPAPLETICSTEDNIEEYIRMLEEDITNDYKSAEKKYDKK